MKRQRVVFRRKRISSPFQWYVVHPKPEPPMQEIVLPGDMQAYIDAPIYARTNGYLKLERRISACMSSRDNCSLNI